ncbi:hypothetical protein KGF54_003824 [Candida jiufengensis]|uniref:uncharacterized protein n=1 Tax=Candida jiufengensis TaxID=497108 RepID=UPI0022250568|nr:uncharacterized protein KGF54_003824 [Candida jiufengensis]KAI5950750.1 hypothetical protein KGF54_003824 [Candida jiufengensis]
MRFTILTSVALYATTISAATTVLVGFTTTVINDTPGAAGANTAIPTVTIGTAPNEGTPAGDTTITNTLETTVTQPPAGEQTPTEATPGTEHPTEHTGGQIHTVQVNATETQHETGHETGTTIETGQNATETGAAHHTETETGTGETGTETGTAIATGNATETGAGPTGAGNATGIATRTTTAVAEAANLIAGASLAYFAAILFF